MRTYRKNTFGRPARWEAAGLEWLRQAGGAQIVAVQSCDDNGLVLEHLDSVRPTSQAAYDFGQALYKTHRAGAPAFGVGPDGWEGNGYFGPNEDLQEISLQPYDNWGEMYAQARLLPMVRNCQNLLGSQGVQLLEKVCERLNAGEFDDDNPPARIHGDLWAGNVLWTENGVVLIDPSAQGGHGLTDLAALELFGCAELENIFSGYEDAAGDTLPQNWRDLLGLHQLSMLLMHVQVFGASYVQQTLRVASRYV